MKSIKKGFAELLFTSAKCPVCHQRVKASLMIDEKKYVDYCGNEFCKKRLERDLK